MTPAEIAAALRKLALEMGRLGAAMECYGCLNPIGDHGREMIRAAVMAEGWADGIEEEEPTA